MSYVIADRVADFTETNLTGPFTLAGNPPVGNRAFADVMSIGDTTDVTIEDSNGNWIVANALYSASYQLTILQIYSSSNGGLPVSFGDGSKSVVMTVPAEKFAQEAGFSVENIAALRAKIPIENDAVNLLGYYASGDGGGGLFYGAAPAAAGHYVDNGGTIILPTDGDGSTAWLRSVGDNQIDIKWFGAKGDGVTDDSSAFEAFKAAYLGEDVTLVLPPGEYRNLTAFIFEGFSRIEVYGYGASFTADSSNFIGTHGVEQNNLHSARIDTAEEKDTTVTCKTPAQAARFPIGSWIQVTAYDMQGSGYPPNHYFNEYQQVTDVNLLTGVVSLGEKLRNTYLDTYPEIDGGGPVDTDLGGPATIYAMPTVWDTEIIFRGIHFNQTLAIYFAGREGQFVDCHFTTPTTGGGIGGTGPGTSKSLIYQNVKCNGDFEVDKAIEHIYLEDCDIETLLVQSASTQWLDVHQCQINLFNGTAKITTVTSSDVSALYLGPKAFGVSTEISLIDCRILEINPTYNVLLLSWIYDNVGGVLRVPYSRLPYGPSLSWMVPGAKGYLISDTFNNLGTPFEILNITAGSSPEGTAFIVTTTLPVPIPSLSTGYGSSYGLNGHPAQSLAFSGCIGCPDVEAPSHTTDGTSAPMYSGGAQSYEFDDFNTDKLQFKTWGRTVNIIVDVIRPYTGVSPTATMQFGAANWPFIDSGGSEVLWNPTIDLKTAGRRIITPNGYIGYRGADSQDDAPLDGWFPAGPSLYIVETLTDAPSYLPIVKLEVSMDQGDTSPQVPVSANIIVPSCMYGDLQSAASCPGMILRVLDADTAVWGANITGTGANNVLVWSNGTNWTVFGK